MDLQNALHAHRLLPLVETDAPDRMDDLAAALVAGGLPVAEVTLRHPNALEALRRIAAHDDLLVGAGTVMTPRQAGEAVEAGARFLVSPGFSPSVAAESARLGIPLVPGVTTATELMAALESGIRTVKFFPAATSGGVAAIRALSAVAPDVRWVPTGGINGSTAADYLALECVLAVGGSWMAPRALVDSGRRDEVEALVRDAVGLRS